MRKYIQFIILSFPVILTAQQLVPTSTENYVQKTVYKAGYQESNLGSASSNEKIETVQYFDGLGRPIQSVAVRQGGRDGQGNDTDLIQHITYDAYGRQTKEYLPLPDIQNDGRYQVIGEADIQTYYDAEYSNEWSNFTQANPYSEKEFEASPLNRVFKQAAPGEDWKLGNGHEVKFDYKSNDTQEVKNYKVTLNFVDNTYIPSLQLSSNHNGYYLPNTLYKTVTKDENWTSGTNHTTEEFKDKQGKVILKRTYTDVSGSSEAHDTYYVYDDYGNLTYVLPPKAEAHDGLPSPTKLSELCYQYKYDQRNRLVEKKIPGKGWEYLIYDNLDRLALTKDANQRKENSGKTQDEWILTKYDVFSRPIYTVVYKSNGSRMIIQDQFTTKNTTANYETKVTSGTGFANTYYTNADYPDLIYQDGLLTVNYYDNYDFLTSETGISLPITNYYNKSILTTVKGLATWNRVRVLGTNDWITTVTGYDEHRRPIYVYTQNDYLGTTDIVESKLDFQGKVEETKTRHIKGGVTITTIEKFTYDHSGRVVSHTHNINDQGEETLATNEYDELGQLKRKKVGNNQSTGSELQVVDYDYNIRGWLTGINEVNNLGSNDLFAFGIKYNDIADVNKRLYNGNISQTLWRTANTDSSLKDYEYTYDALNRITSATDNTGNYNLNSVTYDKMGNILSLNRQGHTALNGSAVTNYGVMDDLVYTYEVNSNKLKKVLDNGNDTYGFNDGANQTTEYTYDANANMKTDTNKGITNVNYNHLNLPTQVTINGQNVNYVYDAAGMKLRKTVNGNNTDYSGNFIYTNNNLEFFNTPEGYVTQDGSGGYSYVYQYRDHVDNIRLSYSDTDGNGIISQSEIIEEKNYYPFGLKMRGFNYVTNPGGNNVANRWGFGGKELQNEDINGKSLDWYDFGARNYDPALGRWMNVDPLAEKMRRHSPYNYAFNNPISFIDPDGMAPEWIVGTDGKAVTYTKNKDGSVTWSDNASEDTREVGNAMLTTEQGTSDLDSWISSSTAVEIEIDITTNAEDTDALAETAPTKDDKRNFILNADGQYEKIRVTFYDKAIDADIKEDSGSRFAGASKEEALGATGSHEVGHNEPDQIKLDKKQPNELKQKSNKNIPFNNEVKFRRQYNQKYPKKGNSNWEKPYKSKGYNGN